MKTFGEPLGSENTLLPTAVVLDTHSCVKGALRAVIVTAANE